MTVLLVTHSDDNASVDAVRSAVEARGERTWRLDTDLLPTGVRFSVSAGENTPASAFEGPEGALPLSEVTAVWWRRTATAQRLPTDMDHQIRAACVEESSRSLRGMVAASGAFTLDPFTVIRRAENKPLQLEVARAAGLDVPRTLTTNDPAAVRRFAASCPGGMVAKMMSSFAIRDDAGREQVVFTNPVAESDLDDLDSLELCPMTFQERVEKSVELRVTVVGDRVMAAAVDSQRLDRAKGDWRREGVALLRAWQPYALPADVAAGLLRYMERFELNYGAADFIVTPEGRHVFLEVNPAGEWFWLQESPGLPIAEALADVLVGRAPRRGGRW